MKKDFLSLARRKRSCFASRECVELPSVIQAQKMKTMIEEKVDYKECLFTAVDQEWA